MSVIMTMWVKGDPDELERLAAADPEGMRAIADRAKQEGLIAHRFYGADGQILVLDEWGYPIVDPTPLTAGLERHAKRAAAACPTLALLLERTDREAR